MKKFIVLLLAVVILLSFASCGGNSAEIDTAALSAEVLAADLFEDQLFAITEKNVNDIVGVDTANCASFEYYMGTGVTGEEFGLFVCNSKKDAENLKAQLETHQAEFEAQYADYAPEYVPVIKGAIIRQEGNYVLYLAAKDDRQAKTIADKYFG